MKFCTTYPLVDKVVKFCTTMVLLCQLYRTHHQTLAYRLRLRCTGCTVTVAIEGGASERASDRPLFSPIQIRQKIIELKMESYVTNLQ